MKTPHTLRFVIPLIALFTLLLGRPRAAAQDQAPASIELLAGLPENAFAHLPAPDGELRYELVDQRYQPTAYSPDAMLRIVKRLADGRAEVRVIASDGSLRMAGTYLDLSLSVAHGTFEFFHADGNLESKGAYVMDAKTGAWERFAIDGRRLPDRLYLGLSLEQLQIALGDAEEACTLEQ